MVKDSSPDIGTVATAEMNGFSIRYARAGIWGGIPILLTAPGPESIYFFHRLVPRLAEKHQLLLVDLPGFGLSQSHFDVMSPENDRIVPPVNGQFLSDRIPNNRNILLDAEHRIWEEAATEYIDAIVSWIDGDYQ